MVTNKHNQKLNDILENQKIYGGFMKMGSRKWNPKYQYFKKTSFGSLRKKDLLVFQYGN